MNETLLQLDMTAFYGAEKALTALRAGRVPATLEGELRTEMAYLGLVLAGSVLFDRVTVAVPAVIDDADDRQDFGPHASPLSRSYVQARLAGVMKVAPTDKSEARNDLSTASDDYTASAAEFLTQLKRTAATRFRDWARDQLANAEIKKNTADEEESSEFHKTWTVDFTERVLALLKTSHKTPLLRLCTPAELRHIVTNCGRGFIYEAAGAQRGTFYVPHFLREGLLGHLKADQARARALVTLCSSSISQTDLAQVLRSCRLPSGDVPLLRATILDELLEKRVFDPGAVTDMILRHRESKGNIALRQRLAETLSGPDPDLRVGAWIDRIRHDRQVWAGRDIPKLFKTIPALVQLVPGVNYEKAKIALEGIIPLLKSTTTFGRTLRSPIYLRRHMRYLWRLYQLQDAPSATGQSANQAPEDTARKLADPQR